MFETFYKEIENIEGWFSKEDAKIFYDTIPKLKNLGSMVEIGSWCGKSLIFSYLIAKNNNNNCKKYSIDPFVTSKNDPNGKYEQFITNLKKYNIENKITHIKEKSNEAGKNFKDKIEFLFLDGFHVYEYVKEEFNLFFKKVIKNGFVLFHDVGSWYGPTQLVYELAEKNDNIKFLTFSGRTILAEKVDNLTKQDKENNLKIANSIKENIKSKNIKLKY